MEESTLVESRVLVWGLTWGDVDAGYGDCRLLQHVEDGTKRLSHSPLEAEAEDGVYHQVVSLINHFSLRNQLFSTLPVVASKDQQTSTF